jgi:hypothetical protein
MAGVGVVGLACLACLAVFLPCTVTIKDSEGWVESHARLKTVGQALLQYHESYGRLPPAVVPGKGGKPEEDYPAPLD